MKSIYIFYLYDDINELNDEKYPGIQGLKVIKGNKLHYVLYAWTINKSIRKKFKKQRNMDIFREVVCEIEKDDFNKFSDEYSNTFLEERPITTKIINEERIISKTTSYVLTTRNELDYMAENDFQIAQKRFEKVLTSDIYIREKYFSDIYRDALHFFKLDTIMAYTYPLEDNDIPFVAAEEDKLSIYTHLYHNTYRKELNKI